MDGLPQSGLGINLNILDQTCEEMYRSQIMMGWKIIWGLCIKDGIYCAVRTEVAEGRLLFWRQEEVHRESFPDKEVGNTP